MGCSIARGRWQAGDRGNELWCQRNSGTSLANHHFRHDWFILWGGCWSIGSDISCNLYYSDVMIKSIRGVPPPIQKSMLVNVLCAIISQLSPIARFCSEFGWSSNTWRLIKCHLKLHWRGMWWLSFRGYVDFLRSSIRRFSNFMFFWLRSEIQLNAVKCSTTVKLISKLKLILLISLY